MSIIHHLSQAELIPFKAAKRKVLSSGQSPLLPTLRIPFKPWDGEFLDRKLHWHENFGKGTGQVYSLDGKAPLRSCCEVEVAKLFRKEGFTAYWISSYDTKPVPDIWRPFALTPREMPEWLCQLDLEIRQSGSLKNRGGIFDVVAWYNQNPRESAYFIECKKGGEPIGENQEDWVCSALKMGMNPQNFGVVIRDTHFNASDSLYKF